VDFDRWDDQGAFQRAVAELAARFDDPYWRERDARREFPPDFQDAFAAN
jgi:acyl-CoA dehydrogenase